jgi:PAS domain S-box-containing protein
MERALLNKQLQDAEVILDCINDGFFIVDEDWNFVHINKGFERICNGSKEEYLGRNYWDMFPKARELKFYKEYHRALKEQRSVQFEEYAPLLDRWISSSVYPFRDGLAVYFTDISEERKLQQKVANDEHNLRALINNTADLIWSVDPAYNIILANNAFIKWTESKLGEPLMAGDYLFHKGLGEELISHWKKHYKRVLKGESFSVMEVFTRKGRYEYAEARLSPISDVGGRIVGASCTSRDITKQRNDYLLIERQNNRLREIAHLQSHKVRSHVARILGLKQLFNSSNPADPLNKQLLDDIEKEVLRLDEVIREIHDKTIVTDPDLWDQLESEGDEEL